MLRCEVFFLCFQYPRASLQVLLHIFLISMWKGYIIPWRVDLHYTCFQVLAEAKKISELRLAAKASVI